jgi:general secretion pathway protein F
VRSFEGADEAAARDRAAAAGLQVLGRAGGSTPGGSAGAAAFARGCRRGGARAAIEHGELAEELATLLGAGLGLVEAVQGLRAGGGSASRQALLAAIARQLEEGRALSDALAAAGDFPPLLVAAVRASERTGELVSTLQRHAQHERRMQQLRARVAGAATYPLILLAVGSAVVLFLLGFVVPRFATLVESSRAELPWASRWLMGFGRAVAEHPQALAAASAALAVLFILWVRRLRRGGTQPWLTRLPLVRTLARLYRHAQLYRMAAALVGGGVPAAQALAQCAPLLPGRDGAALLAAVTRLREGHPISTTLADAGLADALAQRMLVVAERSGTLAPMLERIGERLESLLQARLDRVGRWIEPLLMIAIGLVIGAIVVLMYLPIFDLATQLQ